MNKATSSSRLTYRLRAELIGHTSDVRGVSCCTSGQIATASRDRHVRLWDLSESSEPLQTLSGHDHWVNDVHYLDNSRLSTACADGSVRIFDASSGMLLHKIDAHAQAACALSSDGDLLVSSSWDKTARVWDAQSGSARYSCGPHDAAVWAALPLSDGQLVTVSADKGVRLWSNNPGAKCVVLSTAHTDVVRDVAHAPDSGFVTVSNDSSLVFWRPTAGGQYTPAGGVSNLHDGNYIYAVDGTERDGKWCFVTAGEDNCVRVVEACVDVLQVEFKCVQTIMHPGTVWDVAMHPNGDIVTGCSDGVARVFTLNPDAVADGDVVAAFDKAVSSRKVSTKLIGGVDVSKLQTSSDALSVPGSKDGENKIVRNANGTPEVHMWSAADQKWSKIGDVVDDPTGGISAGTVLGKSYDFVFDVELGESGPKKRLGYNRGENPYAAAQRFIDDNELDQDFLDQIATFITQQVPADAIGESTRASDPLTGGGRYVPGSTSSSRGASRGDPLTGGSRYVPGGATSKPHRQRYLPLRTGAILFLKSTNVSSIVQKVTECQSTLRESGAGLTDAQMEIFTSSLAPKLHQIGAGRSGVILEDAECDVVEHLVRFPTESVFPSLDVARLVVGVPSGGSYFFGKQSGGILDNVLGHAFSPKAGNAVLIMACRFVCNLFGNRVVASVVREKCEKVINSCAPAGKAMHTRARETFAAVLSNYALMLYDAKAALHERALVMQAITSAAEGEKEERIVYALNVSLGTLMMGDEESRQLGVQLGAARMAAEAAPKSERLQQVAEELARLIVNE